uniref:LAM_G_DOMAIN domain-containing protein n=1 Tax=Steinernema glaseri TaxID=37863 RepID=A0A1I8A418_9BILA
MTSRLRYARKSHFSSEDFDNSPSDIKEPDFTDEETLLRMKELIPAESFEAIDISKPVVEVGQILLCIGHQQVELTETNVPSLHILRDFAYETSIVLTFHANTVLYGLRYLIKTNSFSAEAMALRLNFGMVLPSRREQVHTVYLDLSQIPKMDDGDYHTFYLELGTDDGRLFAERSFRLSLKDVKGIKNYETIYGL